MAARPRAVLFDLLTALLDSGALWDAVAGDAEKGRRWRGAYLRNTYAAGAYRPYEQLVREAASEVGLPEILADRLVSDYGGLAPWPEGHQGLGETAEAVLFVAGSPYDLFGATALGMPVFWHNRRRMTAPPGAPAPLAHHDNLYALLRMV